MKKLLVCVFTGAMSQLCGLQVTPWLGNWLEFEGSLYQKHTESKKVDTTHGTKHEYLHSEKSVCSLEFMPLEDLSTELEFAAAKTQRKGYGFEALKAQVRYNLLNDLVGDPVTLTTGLATSISTPSRIRDLSSTEHAVFESDARVACGREFGYSDNGFYKAWAMGLMGVGSSGSGWVAGEVHVERELYDRHHFDLFLTFEKGLSSHKLHHIDDFHSYSRLGYEFEEVGFKYTLKEIALGSLYLQYAKRLHARYCPRASWSVEVGFLIPFSPW